MEALEYENVLVTWSMLTPLKGCFAGDIRSQVRDFQTSLVHDHPSAATLSSSSKSMLSSIRHSKTPKLLIRDSSCEMTGPPPAEQAVRTTVECMFRLLISIFRWRPNHAHHGRFRKTRNSHDAIRRRPQPGRFRAHET